MNLLLLLAGVRVWTGTPVEWITRAFLAVSLFSFEMQLVTWAGTGTLGSLVPVNAVLACGLFVWSGRRTPAVAGGIGAARPSWRALAGLAAVTLVVNLVLPLAAADPYHLERVNRIGRLGTLAYGATTDSKVNVFGWLYELALADLRAIPIVGAWGLRLHGVVELAFLALTIAAVFALLGRASKLGWWLLLVVPVVFHQLVLVKNDLFGAMPAVVALAWLVARANRASPVEVAWAAWLTGIGVGMKMSSFPLALVVGAGMALAFGTDTRRLGSAAVGLLVGLAAGGLLFTVVENSRMYGSSLGPIHALGNRTTSLSEAATSVTRFAISLFDLGTVTRHWWPGRGGWGATYGLPIVWALGVLTHARHQATVRRTLWVVGGYWLAFAAVYPDADVAHRLALAPGLLAIAVAATVVEHDATAPRWMHQVGVVVAAISGVQVARSAVLYLVRA